MFSAYPISLEDESAGPSDTPSASDPCETEHLSSSVEESSAVLPSLIVACRDGEETTAGLKLLESTTSILNVVELKDGPKGPSIFLEDVSKAAFEVFRDCLTGKSFRRNPEEPETLLREVFELTVKYRAKRARVSCEKWMSQNITSRNFLEFAKIAHAHGAEVLLRECANTLVKLSLPRHFWLDADLEALEAITDGLLGKNAAAESVGTQTPDEWDQARVKWVRSMVTWYDRNGPVKPIQSLDQLTQEEEARMETN